MLTVSISHINKNDRNIEYNGLNLFNFQEAYGHDEEVINIRINMLTSHIGKTTSNANNGPLNFKLALTDEEMKIGCKLGIDSWADTSCVGKHAYIESYVEGKTVTANAFSSDLPAIKNLPIVNARYAYDSVINGKTYILCINQAISLGNSMEHALLCPNQCRANGIQIDTRPSVYYPGEPDAQHIIDPLSGERMPIYHFGPMPYINVRRPTDEEILTCDEIHMTSMENWSPYESTYINETTTKTRNLIDLYNEISDETDDYDDDYEEYDMNHNRVLNSIGFDRMMMTDNDNRYVSVMATNRNDRISAEELSKLWRIGLKTAARTVKATTHQCLRTTGILTRRFRTDKAHMRYKQLATKHGQFYVDTLFSKVKSLRGYTCGNLYTNNLGFKKFYPMMSNTQLEAAGSLKYLVETIGLPRAIHADNHVTFTHGDFRQTCKKYQIPQTWTEPYSPWQNKAEIGIKQLKSYAYLLMQSTNTPIRLWCFCFEYCADILSLMATGLFQLGGRTPFEVIMNYTPDISEYVSFLWYQWSYYWDHLEGEKKLCRWLGPAHQVGQSCSYWILKSNGEAIVRSTVIPAPDSELNTLELKNMMENFTTSVHSIIGDHSNSIVRGVTIDQDRVFETTFNYNPEDDDEVRFPWSSELSDLSPYDDTNEKAIEEMDEYVNTHFQMMNEEGIPILVKVKGRKRDQHGNLVGERNPNPILDTRVFNVEYPDGRMEEVSTNVIAESLFSECDADGFNTAILDEIVDIRKDDNIAIPIEEGYATNTNGQKKPVITTKGWDIKVRWTDGTHDWIPLTEIRNCDPIRVAEFAVARGVDKEPAFNWWVRKVLRKRDRIINKVKTRRMKRPNMKFGVIIPTNVEEALKLDEDNGNHFWEEAIKKEHKNVRVAFNPLEPGEKAPPGYKEITCHMNFEVKMDLRRKARYVAGGHLTDPPTSMTYSSVVSRESIRIAFLLAALNDMDILACDIQNAYLNAPTKEKLWFKGGKEWGKYENCTIIIVRALYGLKSSGKQWRSMFSDKLMNEMGFKSCLADPDVWYKPMTKSDGTEYYAYILVYVDDVLIVDHNPKQFMSQLESLFTIKEGSIGPPSVYLGANIQKVESRSGGDCWGASAQQYVRDSIKNIKARLKENEFEYNKKLSSVEYSPQQPFSNIKYKPEIDTSALCNENECSFYQNLIGILRWTVELGRIDIAYEVSRLSQFLANPRIGHLQQALHVFKYMDIHQENFISFDPTRLEIDMSSDNRENPECKAEAMREFYPDAKDDIPPNAPPPRGKAVQINTFVDADHAGNVVTRRSHTGILVFMNMAPIYWYSKRQNMVESSTFSSEFVALKTAVELIISLRYKLRMMGVPLEGPARIFCDNEAVYKNASYADSVLRKKHNSIAYHRVREAVAAGICYVIKEETGSNLADILTKSLPKEQRKYLRARIMVNAKVKNLKSD